MASESTGGGSTVGPYTGGGGGSGSMWKPKFPWKKLVYYPSGIEEMFKYAQQRVRLQRPLPPGNIHPLTRAGTASLTGYASAAFNPLPSIQRGVSRANAILTDWAQWLQLVQMIRGMLGLGGGATASGGGGWAYGYPTQYPTGGPTPLPQPPATTGAGYPTPTQGGSNVYSFLPTADVSGGSSWLTGLTGLASAVGGIVSAFNEPAVAQAPSSSIFNIPGYDIQSPIVSEATVAQQSACQRMQSPFSTPTNGARAHPQMFVARNPVTGKPTFFAPVKITGVRVFGIGNMVRRRRGKR